MQVANSFTNVTCRAPRSGPHHPCLQSSRLHKRQAESPRKAPVSSSTPLSANPRGSPVRTLGRARNPSPFHFGTCPCSAQTADICGTVATTLNTALGEPFENIADLMSHFCSEHNSPSHSENKKGQNPKESVCSGSPHRAPPMTSAPATFPSSVPPAGLAAQRPLPSTRQAEPFSAPPAHWAPGLRGSSHPTHARSLRAPSRTFCSRAPSQGGWPSSSDLTRPPAPPTHFPA